MTIDIYPTYNLLARPGASLGISSFWRESDGWCTGPLGTVTGPHATNTAREDFDSVSGAFRGWLCEKAATNLLLNSFTPATQTLSVSAGVYTLSVHGSGSAALSGAATGTATQGAPCTVNCPSGGSLTVTVSGLLEAFQLEAGSFATSPIATTTAAASRGHDYAYCNTMKFPFNAAEGTLYVEASTFGAGAPMAAAALAPWDPNSRLTIRFDAERRPEVVVLVNGAEEARLTLTEPVAVNQPVKMAAAYGSGSLSFCMDGGAAQVVSVGAFPSMGYAVGGNGGGDTEPLNGHLRHLAYFPRRLADEKLQLLTR